MGRALLALVAMLIAVAAVAGVALWWRDGETGDDRDIATGQALIAWRVGDEFTISWPTTIHCPAVLATPCMAAVDGEFILAGEFGNKSDGTVMRVGGNHQRAVTCLPPRTGQLRCKPGNGLTRPRTAVYVTH